MDQKQNEQSTTPAVQEHSRTAFDSEALPHEWPNLDAWRRSQGMLVSAGELQGGDVPRDELGRILPGHSLNPNGRQPGSENFKTIFEKALKEVAKLNKLDPEDLHAQIIAKGIQSARKGDFRFYKDLLDRLYGRPKEKIALDHTTGGMPIQGGNQITFVNFGNDSKG